MERFAKRHLQVHDDLLGTDFGKMPSDSTFRLLLPQLDVDAFEALLKGWMAWTLRAMPAPEWAMDTWPGSATIIAVSTTGMGCGKPVDVDAVGRRPSPALSLRVCASSPGPCSGCSPALGDQRHLALGPARAPAGRKPSLKEVTGVQILATLRTMGLNALRLVRMTSIAEGIAAVAHDILAILRLRGWREVA